MIRAALGPLLLTPLLVTPLLVFAGCAHPAPPSGYVDLHNSGLAWVLDAEPSAVDAQLVEWKAANTAMLVLSLGQASFPLGETHPVKPAALPSMMKRARRLLANGPPWVGAIEGGSLLVADARWLQELSASGVRIVGFGHHRHDQWIEPARPPEIRGPSPVDDSSRLSAAGRRLVTLLNGAGFVVDLAHLGRTAFAQTVELLDGRPLLVSHTGARALCDSPRNLSDAHARQVAKSGGLVGVIFHSPLLRCDGTPATVDDVASHIEHFVSIMGPAHVALGTDWRGRTRPPEDLRRPGDLGRLESALMRRGMPAAEIQGVLYGNAARWLGLNAPALTNR
ncbi:MAG: microsomal dipeptidase-like Zn-dependent dipeptidase [Myxococcota bacterium]